MKGIIDRFEGTLAIVETDDGMIQIDILKLPKESKEGDALLIEGDDIRIDIEETRNRKKRIRALMDELLQ